MRLSNPWIVLKNYVCSCNVDNENENDNDALEIAIDADNNDVEIENDAMLDENIVNNNTTDDDLILTNNDEENIIDNNHFYEEFQNEIVNDAIQNIASDELVNDVHADATDDTDRSRECRVKLTHEMNNGEHKELIKGLLLKIIGKNFTTHATNKKNIIKWLECSHSKQPYILLKKTNYKNYIKKKLTLRSRRN